jgi:phage shock protein A
MALLERVSKLVRANFNDLIDRAEDPEKMIKQVILDMKNQLMQVKTQVALAMVSEHVLRKKQNENAEEESNWMRKAGLAVDKKQDDLARAALGKAMSYRNLSASFEQQLLDQKTEVENLKTALHKLEQKLVEAEGASDLLIARHRKARAVAKARGAQISAGESHDEVFGRMAGKVRHAEAVGDALTGLAADNMEARLSVLDKDDKIERLLEELKASRHA